MTKQREDHDHDHERLLRDDAHKLLKNYRGGPALCELLDLDPEIATPTDAGYGVLAARQAEDVVALLESGDEQQRKHATAKLEQMESLVATITEIEAAVERKLAADRELREVLGLQPTASDEDVTAEVARLERERRCSPVLVDDLIDAAYREGRLIARSGENGEVLPSPNEDRLRRIGLEEGVEVLKLELAEMPRIDRRHPANGHSRALVPTRRAQ